MDNNTQQNPGPGGMNTNMSAGNPVGQPMNNMGSMQPGMTGTNMSMTQPGMMQPMPQPKQPMDPAKKRKIIIGVSAGVGAAVLAIVAAIAIPLMLRVDYSTAYQVAKELKPKLYDIYYSYDCGYVVDYVNSTYTSVKSYSEYVDNCKATYDNGAASLVQKLGDTEGIKRNDEIKLQYEKFNSEFSKLTSGSTSDLDAKLELWQARHNFVVTSDDLSYASSADSEFTTAANYLIESGNDTLKEYGEGWLARSLEVSAAYREYRATTTGWSAAYNNYTNKKNELSDWVAANKPDINVVAPLSFNDTSKMYSEFTTLYNLISETYEKNYNSGSGDCTEFLGEVYCE